MPRDARRRMAAALTLIAAVLVVAAALVGYAQRALLSSDQFADRATATLHDPSVRTLLGDRITDRLVLADQEDLLAARPLISSAVSSIVGGSAFGSLFRHATRDVHRAVLDRDQDTITLTVADVGTVAGAALEKVRPALAAKLDQSRGVTVVNRKLGSVGGDVARLADRVRLLAWLLPLLALGTAAGALVASLDRRRTAAQLGLGLVGAGVAIVVAFTIARALVVGGLSDPDEHVAAGAVWGAFLGDLRTWGWVTAGAGAVVAAAATSLVQPVAIEGPLRGLWRIVVTEPSAPWLRAGRAGALIAAGVVLITQPLAALQVGVTLAGVYLVYKGVDSIMRLIHRPPDPAAAPTDPRLRRLRRAIVPGLATVLVAIAVAGLFAGGGVDAPAAAIPGCNGHAALCDRPLDEVVLPATHNSMSVPLPGWFSAEQERPIGGQLDDGIRGLLLDTHYGDKLSNGRVRTAFDSPADLARAVKQDGLSTQSVRAAERLRARLGFRGAGTRGMYLCHTFCELGATPLSDGLEDVHDFLVTHPTAVVVVINQDYVTPADFVGAVDDAGLTQYVFQGLDRSTWPTLREMIDDDQRLVLLAENHAGAAPWYQLAYERLTEETPFDFGAAALLTMPAKLAASCRPNRGPETAPLFLINHWVTTAPLPRPSDAAKINAYDALLARARACQRIRKHLPNLLAVNFYRRGDLFRVVDTLNRTAPAAR